MSCHRPDTRKSAAFRQYVLFDEREGQISKHDVRGDAMTINMRERPE